MSGGRLPNKLPSKGGEYEVTITDQAKGESEDSPRGRSGGGSERISRSQSDWSNHEYFAGTIVLERGGSVV